MVGDFNISSIVIGKAGRRKISKILGDLNNAMKACVCAVTSVLSNSLPPYGL